jgi:hypothetical protein
MQWLDAHFDRHGDEQKPGWSGLTLTLREWGLDDEPRPPVEPAQPRKAVLRA